MANTESSGVGVFPTETAINPGEIQQVTVSRKLCKLQNQLTPTEKNIDQPRDHRKKKKLIR